MRHRHALAVLAGACVLTQFACPVRSEPCPRLSVGVSVQAMPPDFLGHPGTIEARFIAAPGPPIMTPPAPKMEPPAKIEPTPQDIIKEVGIAYHLFKDKKYIPFLGALILILVKLLRMNAVRMRVPWLATKYGGWALAAFLAFGGGIGVALSTGHRVDIDVILASLISFLVAVGLHTGMKDMKTALNGAVLK